MKVVTILGTRPEIIRLSRVIPLLDQLCEHVLVHTGQNFEPLLSDVFFDELGVRAPDHTLDCRGSTTMEQVGRILVETERVLHRGAAHGRLASSGTYRTPVRRTRVRVDKLVDEVVDKPPSGPAPTGLGCRDTGCRTPQ